MHSRERYCCYFLPDLYTAQFTSVQANESQLLSVVMFFSFAILLSVSQLFDGSAAAVRKLLLSLQPHEFQSRSNLSSLFSACLKLSTSQSNHTWSHLMASASSTESQIGHGCTVSLLNLQPSAVDNNGQAPALSEASPHSCSYWSTNGSMVSHDDVSVSYDGGPWLWTKTKSQTHVQEAKKFPCHCQYGGDQG